MSLAYQSKSYGHRIQALQFGYQISWTVDIRPAGSRVRYPRRYTRITTKAGAQRFAKKWRITYE